MAPRDVVFVIYPGIQGLDLVGPAEVFTGVNRELGRAAYRVRVAAAAPGVVSTHAGMGVVADVGLAEIDGPLDTLMVVGGEGTRDAVFDEALVAEVARLARRSSRVTSVCSGAFVLAMAGLLDGRRATTHWQVCELLATSFPTVDVDPEPIFVRDGQVYTSAGVTSGMDLALALVEDDHGRDVALAVARRLVLFLRRPGNQAQFSATLAAQMAERDGLREAQRLVIDHPERDWTVASMARSANLSERHFARCFTDEVGVTPARYVEAVRVEAARRLLEETDHGVEAVAGAAGFGTAETMRRAFLRIVRTSPSEYRNRFRAA
ncbi:MAG: GlxA family transcriptional regulator [Actinomycetota bacterium]|nr:GlxA family transcriptional regulator [Actinomycetota bacterium]